MSDAPRLTVDDLARQWLPQSLQFQTTAELEPAGRAVIQERGMRALEFGLGISGGAHNVFAVGEDRDGIRRAIEDRIERYAEQDSTPGDWCYVHDFENAEEPNALRFPPGRGAAFARDVDELIENLKVAIPEAFESEEYQTQRQMLVEELQSAQEEAFTSVHEQAEKWNIAVIPTPTGVAFAPIENGEIIAPDAFQQLPEEKRAEFQERIRQLEEQFRSVLERVSRWETQQREELRSLNEEVTQQAVGRRFDSLRQRYQDLPDATEHLRSMERHIVRNAFDFVLESERREAAQQAVLIPFEFVEHEELFERYRVNVLVDNGEEQGAPVVWEPNPTWEKLVGRIDHAMHFGTLVTNFRRIRSGALHRANGGYLILEADKLLRNFGAWERLKRALRTGVVRMEPPEPEFGMRTPVSLEPSPIPIDVKVVLVGGRELFYLLEKLDPEFSDLFEVVADFDDELDRAEESNAKNYASVIAGICREESLPAFDRSGVERLLRWSARHVDDREKLTTDLDALTKLMREGAYFARQHDREVASAADVETAVDAREERRSRVPDRSVEAVRRGVVLIETEGERVGQVNGLSVVDQGGHRFGRPVRITARARVGDAGIVDIEREVELGGPIHSKGIMILEGMIGGRYALQAPLAVSASLVFEQSYGGVEGDSASLAETCALLSELARVPITQNLAVTGSINQKGDVQAVGGINEKVEGFFEVCLDGGLTGEQGVIVPRANVEHLVLDNEVLAAIEEERFSIYAVADVDSALERLTGLPAGSADEQGEFPADTVNGRVTSRLREFSESARAYRGGEDSPDSE